MSGHASMKTQTSSDSLSGQPLWAPTKTQAEGTQIFQFAREIERRTGQTLPDYQSLWRWSIENTGAFWDAVWDTCGVIGDKGTIQLQDGDQMPGAQFFPVARLNFAENLLRRRDDGIAMIFRDEKEDERSLTFADVYEQVSRWSQALRAAGVTSGDRVAAFMPNMPETMIAMLATATLGAIWSSASPDFGTQGLLDRFGQVEPTVFVAVDGYFYNGKTIDCLSKVREVQPQLRGLKKTVIVPFTHSRPDLSGFVDTVTLGDFIAPYAASEIAFNRVAFNHPLFIMFSSGTTGIPKCIVHGHGGTLLQHLKEHRLQCDIRRDDRVFYFTTCGWMMWNWLVSALASEATLLLFDGSPFYPNGRVLWDFTTTHHCTLFGTAAKYIDALKANNIRPIDQYDLTDLRTVTSTGSPLVHESFDFVYSAIKKDVHLASISGGTDIVSCFVLGNPLSPVWRGEIQGAGLGMAVDAFDDDGQPIPAGAGSGELVCTKPFPSMPVGFWNDDDGAKYKKAYFERFDNVWCHGDWIERTVHGGFIIHGRSDATLNPGGVRIGTAEIYRQVEQIPEVFESIAVGQDWDNDVRVILFVRMKEGQTLTDDVKDRIKKQIRIGASPRHVPAKIIQVTDIPRTKSNKIVELAVREVIHNRPVKNVEALANPEALALYKDLAELQN
ncbi:MAG: acetoacetate--CoA ligase [Alphaproteobacteria bacterium]|nr:acetoacetate--CoA ligase [Alphaproteobacteria bacterium]